MKDIFLFRVMRDRESQEKLDSKSVNELFNNRGMDCFGRLTNSAVVSGEYSIYLEKGLTIGVGRNGMAFVYPANPRGEMIRKLGEIEHETGVKFYRNSQAIGR